MSRMVELVVPEVPTGTDGLEEQFVSFGEEEVATEPRTFLFEKRLRLTLQPTAPHILNRVGEKLGTGAASFALDETLVLDWSARRLNGIDATALRALFKSIPRPFAITIETGTGEGTQIVASSASLAFDTVDPVVRGETQHELTVVFVDSE